MGEAALRSHMNSDKHRRAKTRSDSNLVTIQDFFKPKDQGAPSSKPATAPTPVTVAPREDTLNAKILWCLKVVEDHLSFRSCQNNNELFQRMFPDSAIAKGFKLSETKCRYMVVFGLGPYVQDLLCDHIKNNSHYVILFDESLNKTLQSKQMDFLLRIWQDNEVHTRYLTSVFIGHGTAANLREELQKVLHSVGLAKLLQISMDGPNVNWRMYQDFARLYKTDLNQEILDLGSCGLHVMNGAFLTGVKASGWEVEGLLSSLYYLFADAPARREDYQSIVGDDTMPLKFCKTRWLESVPAAERALQMWDNILKYVKAVEEKKVPNPGNKSFEMVRNCSKAVVFPARLCFFISVGKLVNPFLTLYQTDAPMIPFLAEDFRQILSNLMKMFLKLNTSNSAYHLMQVDVEDGELHLPVEKVDKGFYAEKRVKDLKFKKRISDRAVLEFKREAKTFLLAMTKKLIERCPLKYALVRNLGCLDPKKMATERPAAKMKRVLTVLHDANRIHRSCDDVLRQYGEACDESATDPSMRDFDYRVERVDNVLCTFLSKKPSFSALWSIVQQCLLLSHGQVSIERGFSVNKQVEEDNLHTNSIISLRAVYDYIKYVGGIHNVQVSKAMQLSAAAGIQRYHAYLDEQKRNKEAKKKETKRKGMLDELEELKSKKARLDADIKSLQESADRYAEKAESTGQLTFISKSNSLRRTAKEKTAQVEQLRKGIDAKLNALKNS